MKQNKYFWGLVLLFAATLVVALFLPATSSRSKSNTLSRQSLVQLRTLAQGCFVYAANNNDQFPDPDQWRELLIEHVGMDKGEFLSPTAESIEDSYFMAPKAMMWDGQSILLYENPDHWEDSVHVAFGDASADQLPHDEFNRLLAEQGKASP